MTRFVREWGIWDVTRKQWVPDPLKGHIDTSPAKFVSKARAEQIADTEWRKLNPGERFEVRPFKRLRDTTQEMHEMDFTKDDLRVFKAFLDRQPMRGRRFETNGNRLDGGMYLSRVATWETDERGRDYVATHDLGSRNAQQIHRKLRKMGGGIVREGAGPVGRRTAETPRSGKPWPDWEILDSIEKGHALAPLSKQRAYKLIELGYIDASGTWKLTDRGRRALRYRTARVGGSVEDYIAVDRNDRTIAGPFKSYSDARGAAGTAGNVKFVPKGRRANEAGLRVRSSEPVDDPEYIIQGLYNDGTVGGGFSEHGYDDERTAIREAQKIARSSWFEGDYVRVITRDGEPVWDSRGTGMSEPRRARESGSDESRGEAYADEQLASDYFRDWAWEQMVEGDRMRKNDPSSVIPLESRADFQRLAKRMLQDMEFDTRRSMNESAEFFTGFRAKLRDKTTVDWFAEELELMQEQIGGTAAVAESRGYVRENGEDDSGLERRPGNGPDFTNASVNRNHAMRMAKAGMSAAEIAKAFPAVFSANAEGQLSQKYDSIYVGSGRKETRYTIRKSAVDDAIRAFKQGLPKKARRAPKALRSAKQKRR